MLKTARPAGTLGESQLPNSNVAHLLSQIKFLHGEVDRLEKQLNIVRSNAAKQTKEATRQYEDIIEQKNTELAEWRSKTGFLKGDVDLPKRCAALEKQLALANSEKSVAAMEVNDLHAKMRKIEAQLKAKRAELHGTVKSTSEESAAAKEHQSRLLANLTKLAEENETLRTQVKQLARKEEKPYTKDAATDAVELATSDVSTQTANAAVRESHSVECQVNTASHFINSENQSVHMLYEALENKTQSCDDYRARLEDLQVVQEDTLRALESTKQRLVEEVEKRRLASDDAEKLSIQVKSLQKKVSTQAATERDLMEKAHFLEEQRQQFRIQAMNAERERAEGEAQLRQYEKDMEHLSANKNFANQQLSMLANENENLRAEVQGLITRESQMSFSLKAKDGEMQELLEAYQSAVRETETTIDNLRFVERELDNARATLASKEEGILFLQEQVSGLHRREQQLILDLQAHEYENDQLHRKLIQSDGGVGELETKCRELQQFLLSRDQVVEELHQSLAELSKQVVVKENESMLLRRRCDSLEIDLANLRSVASSETARNRDLEEANARLVTRDVLSSFNCHEPVSKEMEALNGQLSVLKKNVGVLTERLRLEEEKRKAVESELSRARDKLTVANESKERLEKILLDQTRTLSTLSQ